MKNIYGFTCIELMITVMIIMILAVMSYPVYTSHLARVKRHQAQLALYDIAAELNHYHYLYQTYRGFVLPNQIVQKQLENNYQIELTDVSEDNFMLRAILLHKKNSNDDVDLYLANS